MVTGLEALITCLDVEDYYSSVGTEDWSTDEVIEYELAQEAAWATITNWVKTKWGKLSSTFKSAWNKLKEKMAALTKAKAKGDPEAIKKAQTEVDYLKINLSKIAEKEKDILARQAANNSKVGKIVSNEPTGFQKMSNRNWQKQRQKDLDAAMKEKKDIEKELAETRKARSQAMGDYNKAKEALEKASKG